MAYHDEEWGRPVRDERGLYERLCLEGFQSGLSWLTILRKRENFRRAFAGFDPDAVAGFGERDVARLLGDAGIIRHRGKIEATIAHAHAVVALRECGTPLQQLMWEYRDAPEATELSKRLKAAGFRFVGPATVYAAIWLATGVRHLGGRVLSLENDPAKVDAWRRNVAEAGLGDWAELVDGDAFESLERIDDVFDVVFLDAEKDDYESLFPLARGKVEPGGLVIADNVLSHPDPLARYSAARQADPSLASVTVPLDRGLELSVVLR